MPGIIDRLRRDWQADLQRHKLTVPDMVYGYRWGQPEMFDNMLVATSQFITGPTLEIGCGGGRWTRWLYDRAGVPSVIGLDIHQDALDLARAYEPRAAYVLGNGEQLPEVEVETVFSFDVFLHLPTELVLSYLCQAGQLKGVQHIVFCLPDVTTEAGMAKVAGQMERKSWRDPYDLGFMHCYALPEVFMLLDYAGWEMIDCGLLADGEFVRDRIYVGAIDRNP